VAICCHPEPGEGILDRGKPPSERIDRPRSGTIFCGHIGASTAIAEGAVLLTADRVILDWPGSLRRQDARR